ncbi:hypothetical protein CIB48_g3949 [Xylaria polymorpha]|nr:hypothetical protein CIB48_g3949 [Xylaria polymorpha]
MDTSTTLEPTPLRHTYLQYETPSTDVSEDDLQYCREGDADLFRVKSSLRPWDDCVTCQPIQARYDAATDHPMPWPRNRPRQHVSVWDAAGARQAGTIWAGPRLDPGLTIAMLDKLKSTLATAFGHAGSLRLTGNRPNGAARTDESVTVGVPALWGAHEWIPKCLVTLCLAVPNPSDPGTRHVKPASSLWNTTAIPKTVSCGSEVAAMRRAAQLSSYSRTAHISYASCPILSARYTVGVCLYVRARYLLYSMLRQRSIPANMQPRYHRDTKERKEDNKSQADDPYIMRHGPINREICGPECEQMNGAMYVSRVAFETCMC